MSHAISQCKCPGCNWRRTNSCPYKQAEQQVKDLLSERKVLKGMVSINDVENVLLTYADDRAYLNSGSEWVKGIINHLAGKV